MITDYNLWLGYNKLNKKIIGHDIIITKRGKNHVKTKNTITEEFKKQMVTMYSSGKSATEIVREYGMAKYHLVSKYTQKKYRNHKTTVNEDAIQNKVNREFDGRALSEVAVSDLTYVRMGSSWLIKIFNTNCI